MLTTSIDAFTTAHSVPLFLRPLHVLSSGMDFVLTAWFGGRPAHHDQQLSAHISDHGGKFVHYMYSPLHGPLMQRPSLPIYTIMVCSIWNGAQPPCRYMVAPQAVHRSLPYMGKETIIKGSDDSVGRDGTDMPTLVPYTNSGSPQTAAYEQADSNV